MEMVETITSTVPVRVTSKPLKKKREGSRRFFIGAALVLLGAAVSTPFGYDYYSGKLGLIGPQFEVFETNRGRLIKVPPGGNLQGALEQARSGDIVELQAGAVYNGEIKLPNKPHTDFVTIQSSAAANLPVGKRVSPSQRSSMATIVAGAFGSPAVSAANGAHHYRFIGIEFTTSSTFYNYGLVRLGKGESAERLPHDIEIDRSYIHPHKTGKTRRGIALNSASTVIKNSYIEGFAYPGEETQGICGWTGTRNVQIINNYVEGGAENIMFGGSDPATADLIPADIEIRGNHLNKPVEWIGKATLKTLFQLKNAKRVTFEGNTLTNNWEGSAFRITVRNQDNNAVFSTIEDVMIRDNTIDVSGDGINILGKDDTYPSQTLKRVTIQNNLFTNLRGGNGVDGSGYFIQISDGENVTVANNTALNAGNIVTLHGAMPRGFIFRDNIVGHGAYGIHGPLDLKSAEARAMFQNNVIINLERVSPGDYAFPEGNTLVADIRDVGFLSLATRDFRLSPSSRFRGKGRQ